MIKPVEHKTQLNFFYRNPLISLGTILIVCLLIVLFSMFNVAKNLTEESAIDYAEQYIESLSIFRSTYSSEVVSRVKNEGITISHDHRMTKGAIPFPATFSILLSKKISNGKSGITTSLYSNYPWPWRTDGGPQNEYQKQALIFLESNPSKPYSVISETNGIRTLRYARAVIMKESCVVCHNTDPQSPKRGWKVGDVRGATIINLILPSSVHALYKELSGIALIMLIGLVLAITLLALVIKALRKSVEETELFANETAKSNRALANLNQAFTRFVPHEFLGFLQKDEISDVVLGDHTQKELTILFSDIRDFTSISEQLSPEEIFQFLNRYLSTMGPIVREHNGFIDKYIGDAIMALFTQPDHAILAALDMLKKLDVLNQDAENNILSQDIKIGVGLNTGHLMLGTVGEADRMESTVISDAVNVAARIETLTKSYKTPLLISSSTWQRVKKKELFHVRRIDHVKVKGKLQVTTILEVFNHDAPKMIVNKVVCCELFEEAVDLFSNDKYDQAVVLFKQCDDILQTDPVCISYINKCNEKLNS